MSESEFDELDGPPRSAADTAEVRYWKELWEALEDQQGPWEKRSSNQAHFIESMRRFSSVLEQDKRFWDSSVKYAIRALLADIKEDGLLFLDNDEDFESSFSSDFSFTNVKAMDWGLFSRLIANSMLESLTADDLSRFQGMKDQADEVGGIVTYAHFIHRLHDLIWEDPLIEHVTPKSFINAVIAFVEDPSEEISQPDFVADWRPVEARLRSAIAWCDVTDLDPAELD